jgi:hypothetical protein
VVSHLYKDHVHVTIFDGGNLLAASHLSEYAALDRDALDSACTATGNGTSVVID